VSIRWAHTGTPKTVLIEALKGEEVVGIIAESSANDGYHSWSASTNGQANGSDFGIRVSGTDSGECAAEITGMTITNVSGCDLVISALPASLLANQEFEITWGSQFTSGMVDIELWTSFNGSGLLDQVGIIAFGVADTGSFPWLVDSFHNGTYAHYKLVVRDAQVLTCESVSPSFRMIDEDNCTITIGGPAQAQVFFEGDVLAFQLEQSQGSNFLNLRLYTGNVFVSGGFIADNVSVSRDTSWVVNDFDHTGDNTRFRVKAFDVVDGYCTGVSDYFTIMPARK